MKNYIKVEPIQTYGSLEEEVRDLENKSEKVTNPDFTFKYKPKDSSVTFKVGDKCRVERKTENGALKWDDRHTIEAFYSDKNDPKKILLIEVKTRKDNGYYELKKFPREDFLNFAFGSLGDDRNWSVAREYDSGRETGNLV